MTSRIIRVLLIIVTLATVIYAFIYTPTVQSMLPDSLNPFTQGIHSSPTVDVEPVIEVTTTPEIEVDSLDSPQIDTMIIE